MFLATVMAFRISVTAPRLNATVVVCQLLVLPSNLRYITQITRNTKSTLFAHKNNHNKQSSSCTTKETIYTGTTKLGEGIETNSSDGKNSRESVDSLCRDDADMPMPPYIRKAYNRPNAAFLGS